MIIGNLNKEYIIKLQQLLLGWFFENQRSFPWRETKNPFHILIAEKLLQQTLAGNRVVKAYFDIINRFPDSLSLSKASEDDVLQIVTPLGLHYRAKELINMAMYIEKNFHGELPCEYDTLLEIPGVGEYTAKAILSFAYQENIAIVDTNVARFLFRFLGIDLPWPANPARKKFLADLAQSILPDEQSRNFNLALLDLCAEICKPKAPNCIHCPIREVCYSGTM